MPLQLPDPARASMDEGALWSQRNSLGQQQAQAIDQITHLGTERAVLEQKLQSASQSVRATLNGQIAEIDRVVAEQNARLASVSQRIAQTERSLETVTAHAEVSSAPRDRSMFGLSKDEFAGAFAFVMLFPFVFTVARMLWRRDFRPAKATLDADRFTRLEQAVESIAIEVERVGEAQRFQTKLMTDREHDILPAETRR